MHPDGIIAGTVGDHRVVRQVFAEVRDHGRQVDALDGGVARGRGRVGQVVGMGGFAPVLPGARGQRSEVGQGLGEGTRGGLDRQSRQVDAVQFRAVRMHVDQRLRGGRTTHQAVASARRFAQARPDHQQQVGLAQPLQ